MNDIIIMCLYIISKLFIIKHRIVAYVVNFTHFQWIEYSVYRSKRRHVKKKFTVNLYENGKWERRRYAAADEIKSLKNSNDIVSNLHTLVDIPKSKTFKSRQTA